LFTEVTIEDLCILKFLLDILLGDTLEFQIKFIGFKFFFIFILMSTFSFGIFFDDSFGSLLFDFFALEFWSKL